MLQLNVDEYPFICGVGPDGYWAEWVGFLYDIRQVISDPNLLPCENMEGKIGHSEEYADTATKYVTNFRGKSYDRRLVILSCNDEALSSQRTPEELYHYYEIVWDEEQIHKFESISLYSQRTKAFKTLGQTPSLHQVTLSVSDAFRTLWFGQGVHAVSDSRALIPDASPIKSTECPPYTPHPISPS